MIVLGDRSVELPIQIIDPNSITLADEEMILAFAEHPPVSKFKAGDIAYLYDTTTYLRHTRELIPRFWQVRFVISTWQFELMRLVHSGDIIPGVDRASNLIESRILEIGDVGGVMTRSEMRRRVYEKPYIYAHAFPHGVYPDSAAWFPEKALDWAPFREGTQEWVRILDEARAPFLGFDESKLMAPYAFDMAPDLYSQGNNIERPFSFEEATTHTVALLGGEEILFRPVRPELIGTKRLNDIFAKG